jgi:hypothetical protein
VEAETEKQILDRLTGIQDTLVQIQDNLKWLTGIAEVKP